MSENVKINEIILINLILMKDIENFLYEWDYQVYSQSINYTGRGCHFLGLPFNLK